LPSKYDTYKKTKIVIQARKGRFSIQASFGCQNLALEDFSEVPKIIFEGFSLERYSWLEKGSFHD
jgi:hypothetical protein